MNKSLFYFCPTILILLLSCKKDTKSVSESRVLDFSNKDSIIKSVNFETKPLKQNKNNIYSFSDTLKKWPLPIGNKSLLTSFPEKWSFDPEAPEENKYEVLTQSIYKYTDSLLFYTEYLTAKDSSNYKIFPANQYYKYYDDYVYYNNGRNIKKTISVPVAKLVNQTNKTDLIFEIEVNSFSSSFINMKTIDGKRNEIDGLNIGYTKNIFEFSHSGKYFYIDKNKIIHIKSFLSLEDEVLLNYYERFQILSSGKIVRYFDDDVGGGKSGSEIGKIKNHTQEGKWIEIKKNMYAGETTYAIGDYSEGKPIGNWQYFNLVNNTEKGSKLLMTEDYSDDGKLLKREILDTP